MSLPSWMNIFLKLGDVLNSASNVNIVVGDSGAPHHLDAASGAEDDHHPGVEHSHAPALLDDHHHDDGHFDISDDYHHH